MHSRRIRRALVVCSLLCVPGIAGAQPYRVVAVAPLPGFNMTDLTDLNDRLVGVGFTRLSQAGEKSQPVLWDLNGTRVLTGVSPVNLGPLKINNAGIVVTTGHFRFVGGVSFRNDWLAVVDGVEYTLPSPPGESTAVQLTDSGIVLMYVRQQGNLVLFQGQLHRVEVTSVTDSGIGVAMHADATTTPVINRVFAVFPDGSEYPLWSGPGLGTVLVGATGNVVQHTFAAGGDGFFIRRLDGRVEYAAVPPGLHVSVGPPNAAGDVAGVMWPQHTLPGTSATQPFLYRQGQFIDLNVASGLAPGSIRQVKKITSSGAILVSMMVPVPVPPFETVSDFVLVPTAPPPPTGLAFTVTDRIVNLGWQPSAGAAEYIIEAGRSPGATDFFSGSVGPVTAITAPVPAGRYYVRVRARNALGVSVPSAEIVIDVP